MDALSVYVYGNGQICREIFNAIAVATGGSGYQSLIKITTVFAVFIVVPQYILKRDIMVKVSWMMQYFLMFSAFFMPKVNVMIHDEVHQNHGFYVVSNVPLGVAGIAHITTSIGKGLTELFEQTFSLPDDLQYHKTGMVMASTVMKASTQFQITDPDLSDNLNNFMHQCVFYDLYLDKYTLKDLMSQSDLWTFIKDNASPARAFSYRDIQIAEPAGNTSTDDETPPLKSSESSSTNTTVKRQIITCEEGATKIDALWNGIVAEADKKYGERFFPGKGAGAKAELLKYLPISYSYLAGVSSDASTIMKQLMVKNAFENSVGSIGPTFDASSAMQSFAMMKAQQQKRLTNQTLGKQAAYWLPLSKNVIECIL